MNYPATMHPKDRNSLDEQISAILTATGWVDETGRIETMMKLMASNAYAMGKAAAANAPKPKPYPVFQPKGAA